MDPEDSAGESDIENEDPDEDAVAKQLQFVKLLKRFPVLLDKSQVPAVKNAKKRAATEMISLLADTQAMSLNQQQLMKKINNMKGKIREKTDPEKTGNKKIVLNEWEKQLYALINPKNSNPVFCQIPGAKTVGARIRRPLDPSPITQDEDGAIASSSAAVISRNDISGSTVEGIPPKPPASKKRKSGQEIVDSAETEETKDLSLAQLQRLVLLEQLKLVKMKQAQPRLMFSDYEVIEQKENGQE